ncbi:hypothetical protein diail_8783 [Diaporthe ilicicola]|nr:hypothetical protein diail_8783 [Diaporthe ilicicola]
MSNKKNAPLDPEEVLRQKKQAWKPKFIPKRQREAQRALEAAEEKVREAQKQLRLEELHSQQKLELEERRSKKESLADPDYQNSSSSIPTGPKAMRNNGLTSAHANDDREQDPESDKSSKGKRAWEEEEERLRRERYMGPPVNKSTFSANKKRKRTGNKFNFGWDDSEDTSKPYDPRYQKASHIGSTRLTGFGDEEAEENAKKVAAKIAETGQRHADEYLQRFEAGRKKLAARNSLGKHWSEKTLEEMKERDWRILKENFAISTKGGSIPNPMRTWDESGLPKDLLAVIKQVGYDEPSPIQRAAIPIALQARDLIGVAVTGSGKTAAFLLPLLVYIRSLPALDENNKADGPYALIMAPTRELAQQIESEAKKFAEPLGFNTVSIVGGHSIEEQAFALRNGAEIIVATPGRLKDCIERRLLVLSQCCYIVMDEADRMVDLGFEEALNKILDALPVTNEKPDTEQAENALLMKQNIGNNDLRYRQTMMYTATMPPLVQKIAKQYLRRPAEVTIGNIGEAVDTVQQRVEYINGEDKRKKRLGELLQSGNFDPPIIVFVNIKRNCDAVARDIKRLGLNAVTLHGSKTQEQREAALSSVRKGESKILVATDLAGRGIDVPDVSLVINFNMASSIEAYTHRIGRTGRAGKKGVAITFLGSEDDDVKYELKQMISKSPVSKVPDELRRDPAAQQKPVRGRKTEAPIY